MRDNNIKRIVPIIGLTVGAIIFTCGIDAAIGGFQPKIVQNGVRYRIINEPWTSPIALVARFDDDDENKAMYSGRIVLPDSICHEDVTYAVYGLDEHAFDGCSDLEELVLPNTIETLWRYSLANCGEIKLKLPENQIKRNEYGVFYNTRVIEPFELPAIFSEIGGYFFSAFPWIEEYTFNAGCLRIGPDTFADSNISKIDFENDSSFLNSSPHVYRLVLDSLAFTYSKVDEIKLPFGNLCMYNAPFCDQPQLKKLIIANTPKIYVAGDYRYNNNYECTYGPIHYILIRNCPNLEEIVCETSTPPAIIGGDYPGAPQDDALIMDDNSKTVLKVPAGSEQLYAEHPVWGQFVNISDHNGNVYRAASLNEPTDSKFTTRRVLVNNGSPLSVTITSTSIVSVLNINGVEVCRENVEPGEFTTALLPGVYIVTTSKIF